MGCSQFGERWDVGAEDLIIEAYSEALKDAAIETKDIDAAWFSTAFEQVNVGKSGLPLSETLRLDNIAVTRVENYCASGSEAFRGAVYAVASGAVDIALADTIQKACALMQDGRIPHESPLGESPAQRLERELAEVRPEQLLPETSDAS